MQMLVNTTYYNNNNNVLETCYQNDPFKRKIKKKHFSILFVLLENELENICNPSPDLVKQKTKMCLLPFHLTVQLIVSNADDGSVNCDYMKRSCQCKQIITAQHCNGYCSTVL